MMLRMLDLPEPDLPMSSTFFFLGFLTSLRTPAGVVSPREASAYEAIAEWRARAKERSYLERGARVRLEEMEEEQEGWAGVWRLAGTWGRSISGRWWGCLSWRGRKVVWADSSSCGAGSSRS